MNIAIFNREYWVRRFGEQKVVKGYLTSTHEDFKASLDVHPASNDTLQALPEGERKIKRLEGHGTAVLVASNSDAGTKGDLLYYRDEWYECVSAVYYEHTLLSHWNYQFTLVPNDAHGSIDLEAPSDDDETETSDNDTETSDDDTETSDDDTETSDNETETSDGEDGSDSDDEGGDGDESE